LSTAVRRAFLESPLRSLVLVVWLPVSAAGLRAFSSEAASFQQKLHRIESETLTAGSKIVLTSHELNAYVVELLAKEAGEGLRNPKVTLGTNRAEGSATVDFVKLQTAKGKPPGILLSLLLRGEHDLAVRARGTSGGGTAQIDLEEVSIDGLVIRGKSLDLLIEYYLIPRVPDIKIGRPFELRHNVDRFEAAPDGVTVFIGPKTRPK
jgi:hypothetical protein